MLHLGFERAMFGTKLWAKTIHNTLHSLGRTRSLHLMRFNGNITVLGPHYNTVKGLDH